MKANLRKLSVCKCKCICIMYVTHVYDQTYLLEVKRMYIRDVYADGCMLIMHI